MSALSKRLVCIFIALLMLTALFSGCGEKENDSSVTPSVTPSTAKADNEATVTKTAEPVDSNKLSVDPNKKYKIRFFTSSTSDKVENDYAMGEFYKLYPNIEVETVLLPGAADYRAKVKTAVISGEQVDIIEISTSDMERTQADQLYTPLEEYCKKAGIDLAREYGDYPKQLTVDGKLYALPKIMVPTAVWYNKKHFDEAQIPYPSPDWTWDEFLEIAKKLTKKDASGKTTRYGFFDWRFMTSGAGSAQGMLGKNMANLALYGGWQLLTEDQKLTIDDPRIRKVVERYYQASMVDKIIPGIAETQANKYHYMYDMYKEKWSMLLGCRNDVIWIDVHVDNGNLDKAVDEAETYGMAYMPRWDKNSPPKQAIDDIIGDAVCKTCKNPEAAFIWARWHVTDCLVIASKVAHRMPVSKLLDTKVLYENWTYFQNKDKVLTKGKDRTKLLNIMMDPEIKPIFPEMNYKYSYSGKLLDAFGNELSLLFTGEQDMDTTFTKAKAAMQAVLDSEKK